MTFISSPIFYLYFSYMIALRRVVMLAEVSEMQTTWSTRIENSPLLLWSNVTFKLSLEKFMYYSLHSVELWLKFIHFIKSLTLQQTTSLFFFSKKYANFSDVLCTLTQCKDFIVLVINIKVLFSPLTSQGLKSDHSILFDSVGTMYYFLP